jgi:hypothetical protein
MKLPIQPSPVKPAGIAGNGIPYTAITILTTERVIISMGAAFLTHFLATFIQSVIVKNKKCTRKKY